MLSHPLETLTNDKQCRISIRHIEGGGIGYNHGYTTFEGFFAPNAKPFPIMPFLDIRSHIFDNANIAANVGGGIRTVLGCRIYGINAYYDYRNSDAVRYNQAGFGFETLGKRWDIRIDAYLPQGHTITCPCPPTFIGFSGNQMNLLQKYRFAMTGANGELGIHFAKSRFFELYAAAGAYHFAGEIGEKIWGGKARLFCKFKEYFTLELSNSYDKMFHNRFQFQFTVGMPFGGKPEIRTSCHDNISDMLASRIVQPVERQEIIVVGNTKKCAPAIDPLTHQPFHFVFVDNTSHSKGTFESPYPTLALAQENSNIGNIIYVFPGDETTKGMDQGIILKRNQKFWGSSIDHVVTASQGSFIIPALSDTAPKMTNTFGDGITLDSGNEVSGFVLTDVFNNGIIGTNIESVKISDCSIDNSIADQIHLESSGTSAAIDLDRITLTRGSLNGLFINSTASSTSCAVNNCMIQDPAVYAWDISCANQADINLVNNSIERCSLGGTSSIHVSGPSTIVVSENTFKNNPSVNLAPILINAGTSPLKATIKNNTIRDNECSSIHLILNDTNWARLTIQNNNFTNNGIGSQGLFGSVIFMDLNNTTSGNCDLNVRGNTFLKNEGAALYCYLGNYNEYNVNVANNKLSGNGGGLVFGNGCNTFALNVTHNSITNGRDHGITTPGGITITQANMNISHNRITGNINLADGIALSHDGTNLNLNITDNNISNNEASGIILYSANPIENVAMNIANNIINDNQNLSSNASAGVDIEQFTNLSGILSNNSFSGNTNPSVFIGSSDISPNVCLEMSGNENDNDYVLSNSTGIFNLAPCDVDTLNSGSITTIGAITTVQSCSNATPCP